MTRRANSTAKKTLSRVAGAVKSTAKKVTAKLRPRKAATKPAAAKAAPSRKAAPATARKRRPQSDVEMESLSKAYTPTQTSLKGPFRASGADRQRDQEKVGDDRWNDEDRLTNKSGDPRIGTHGRTYEPGEKRASKGRK
jgi:hypothetical protein